MTVLTAADPATVWMSEGVPARLVWRGRPYVVTDMPTAIRQPTDFFGATHTPERLVGFRFQGTDAEGGSRIFDVHGSPAEGWHVVAYYD